MKILANEGHTGAMILKDGTEISYALRRITRNRSKLIYYTEKGMQEIFKPNMTEEEKAKAGELKKLDEKILIKMGYVSQMPLSVIQKLN